MHVISKSFDFCYGHRVWSQELDNQLSCGAPCKCRHLHGHQGRITITLEAEKLQNGMVTDFTNLAWLKQWIDNNIDHKFLMDEKDPLLIHMLDAYDDEVDMEDDEDSMYQRIMLHHPVAYSKEHLEYWDSFVIVPFIPTSENIAKWLFKLVQKRMSDVKVLSVIFNETPKTAAVYHEV